ncbi:MAG TPA: DinB family protein [Phycisphaerales bacterium]|nr:DinB family protein [Phycisphaerales bacterium]
MTTTTSAPTFTESMQFARTMLTNLLKDFPADKATFQPFKTDNHAMWILGHLALTDHWFLSILKNVAPNAAIPKAPPENWNKLFGHKSVPTPSASAYPSFSEVRAAADAAHNALVKALASLSHDQRVQHFGEAGGGFVADANDLIIKSIWHDGWHAGQLASIRRALGLPPSM